MDGKIYTVSRIDGEYAYISDSTTGEELFIAMALLPLGTDIGTKLKYEELEFQIII